jgi:hypothetical protein
MVELDTFHKLYLTSSSELVVCWCQGGVIAASGSTDCRKGAKLAATCMCPVDILNVLCEQMDQEVQY